jgi:hypothetical protein
VFPVRYGLNLYILFRRNSVFKGLILHVITMLLKYESCLFQRIHFVLLLKYRLFTHKSNAKERRSELYVLHSGYACRFRQTCARILLLSMLQRSVAHLLMGFPPVASRRCDVGLTDRVVANSVVSHQV